jgi:formate hydrogenlyase subunit 3/multisubunit Na+/H+ antiporter MnhD subunit
MNVDPAWAVVVPLAGAVLCVFAGLRVVHWVARATTLGTFCAAMSVAWTVNRRGPLSHAVGGWAPPLGISLHGDGLAAVLLAVIAVVAALLSVYALRERALGSPHASSFFSLWFFAWAALDALVLSADVFNLYVALELMTLAAVALIAIDGGREALSAGLRYLFIALSGSLVYLLGVALLYGVHATLDLALLGARVDAGWINCVAFSLMTLGLGLKTALFPLHGWLPPAYVSTRPVIAALLSSLIGKARSSSCSGSGSRCFQPASRGTRGTIWGRSAARASSGARSWRCGRSG